MNFLCPRASRPRTSLLLCQRSTPDFPIILPNRYNRIPFDDFTQPPCQPFYLSICGRLHPPPTGRLQSLSAKSVRNLTSLDRLQSLLSERFPNTDTVPFFRDVKHRIETGLIPLKTGFCSSST